jgi:hypothetical protein
MSAQASISACVLPPAAAQVSPHGALGSVVISE